MEAEGAGPRVRQVSNAYRLGIPEAACRLLGMRGASPPPPADAPARDTVRREVDAMEARRSIAGAGTRLVCGPLGHALDRLALSLLQRESTGQAEPGQSLI